MKNSGFSLIQISVALVIIGLILGAILIGQNLIQAAAISAQISQIQKYQQAVISFQTKYNGYLPGDIPNPYATQFGFQARGTHTGEGDGNGVLRGNCDDTDSNAYNWNLYIGCGELAVFWVDLSTANLIDTTVKSGTSTLPQINSAPEPYITLTTTPAIKDWLPTAKLGQNNYIYVFSIDGINYFGLSSVTQINWSVTSTAQPGLTVQQAYNIDSKIDDGLPQSGTVTTCYVNRGIDNKIFFYAAGGLEGAYGSSTEQNSLHCSPTTTATVPLSTDCYGNNNTAGVMTYSVSTNANLQNCALSFQFQTQ